MHGNDVRILAVGDGEWDKNITTLDAQIPQHGIRWWSEATVLDEHLLPLAHLSKQTYQQKNISKHK